jgi:diguanylate cyclase (GGDEF)-like protein
MRAPVNEREGGFRILVIDDEPDTAQMLRSWFAGREYQIFEAADGETGLRAATERAPDIIVLDLRMPGIDGHEVARRLKRDPRTRIIPVMLLSASKETDDKLEAFGAGADDYVTKPFVLDEVEARMRLLLRNRELVAALESKNSELEAANKQMEALAGVDEKTGLNNYPHFMKKLHEEWQRAERYGTPLSIVMLDLDDFKKLNDALGHPAGDRALREFSLLVVGGARATDVAARYGGEEFAILLPHTEGSMAVRVAERILSAVREFVFLSADFPRRITVSAGVATFPASAGVNSPETLLHAADKALYSAKKEGKDRVVLAN